MNWPRLPLRLRSAVTSPSISLAPHCSEHLTQKPARSHTSRRAPPARPFIAQTGMCEAAAGYWLKADEPAALGY